MNRPYYLLKMFVDMDLASIDSLTNLYKQAAEKHNKGVEAYLHGQDQGQGPVYLDAGFDLFCPEEIIMAGRQTWKVNHQVKTAMEFIKGGEGVPVGYYLYPRSSTGTKTPLRLANSVGIIDAGYRGHLIAVFDNWQDRNYVIELQQRLVQICPPNLTYPIYVKLVATEAELGLSTERGAGGFGSTGK
jgi:dUTP pyrophosphatase